MPKLLDKLVDRMTLWTLRRSEVGRVDNVGLASLRGNGHAFSRVIESSLRLIREQDARRYARVNNHVSWIVNQIYSAAGANYQPSIRAIFLEFDELRDLPPDIVIAIYATVIIHEATHGLLESRGIHMTADNRVQIERLCTLEQNRFGAGLSAREPGRYPSALLHFDFDEGCWEPEWKKTRAERTVSFIKRSLADRKIG